MTDQSVHVMRATGVLPPVRNANEGRPYHACLTCMFECLGPRASYLDGSVRLRVEVNKLSKSDEPTDFTLDYDG